MNSTEILSELDQELQMNARDPNRPSREEASEAICLTINRLYKRLCAAQNYTPVSVTFNTRDVLAYHQKKTDGSVSIPKECIEVSADADAAEMKRARAEGSTVVDLIVRSDRNGDFQGAMMSDIPTQHYDGSGRRANDALAKLSRILPADADEAALNITSDKYEYTLNAARNDDPHRRRRRYRG